LVFHFFTTFSFSLAFSSSRKKMSTDSEMTLANTEATVTKTSRKKKSKSMASAPSTEEETTTETSSTRKPKTKKAKKSKSTASSSSSSSSSSESASSDASESVPTTPVAKKSGRGKTAKPHPQGLIRKTVLKSWLHQYSQTAPTETVNYAIHVGQSFYKLLFEASKNYLDHRQKKSLRPNDVLLAIQRFVKEDSPFYSECLRLLSV
jgi:hypothetical protein